MLGIISNIVSSITLAVIITIRQQPHQITQQASFFHLFPKSSPESTSLLRLTSSVSEAISPISLWPLSFEDQHHR